MKDLMGMMKQAQQLQEKMAEMQANLETMTVDGVSGGGLIHVKLTGKGVMEKVTIDPSLMKDGEAELLEDLIVAAHNDAKQKVDQATTGMMQELTGGLPLPPDLKLF